MSSLAEFTLSGTKNMPRDYFGPFASKNHVEKTLDVMMKVFRLCNVRIVCFGHVNDFVYNILLNDVPPPM